MNPKNNLFIGMICPIIALLISIPNYIPMLEEIFLGLVLTLFGMGSYFLFKFTLDYIKKERIKSSSKLFHISIVTIVLWGFFILLGLLSAFIFGHGFLGPVYSYTKEFDEEQVVLYVYDASFLKPASSIKTKDIKFPIFVRNLIYLSKVSPDELIFKTKDGNIFIYHNTHILAIYHPSDDSISYGKNIDKP
jgi:hypothetical protein